MVKTELVVDGELTADVNFASDRIGRETKATTVALELCSLGSLTRGTDATQAEASDDTPILTNWT
jgi:hypothetical protein